jgi:hypothetical protein
VPEPAIEDLQVLMSWSSSASLAVHWVRPLVLSFSVLGSVTSIWLAVVLLAGSFLTVSVNF